MVIGPAREILDVLAPHLAIRGVGEEGEDVLGGPADDDRAPR